MSGARPARLALAIVAIGWLLAGIPATTVHAQAPTPTVGAAASASPTATADGSGAIETGDPRSDGQGPGLVGEPLLVLVGIVLLGVATVVVTVLVARATGRT